MSLKMWLSPPPCTIYARYLVNPIRCSRPQRQVIGVVAAAKQSKTAMSEADLYVEASPAPSTQVETASKTTKVPFYIYGPLGFLALLGISRAVGAVLRRSRGSLSEDYRREGTADENYYDKMMRGMKTTQYEELSEEQILAARRRRMREIARDSAPLDLDQVELPDNHPFAVKKQLSPDEEQVQTQRLRARRGLSEEDMRKLREAQRQSMAEE